MDWKTLLAYVTGSVDAHLMLHNEYLAAENGILRNQITDHLHSRTFPLTSQRPDVAEEQQILRTF